MRYPSRPSRFRGVPADSPTRFVDANGEPMFYQPGTRVEVVTVTESGYQSFNGRCGTVTRAFVVQRDGRPVPRVDIDVDDYPWGYQTDAAHVRHLDDPECGCHRCATFYAKVDR